MIVKLLDQSVFNNAPDWVKSAAVDGDGTGVWHYKSKSFLIPRIFCEKPMFKRSPSAKAFGSGFDTNNWQNSAINRL